MFLEQFLIHGRTEWKIQISHTPPVPRKQSLPITNMSHPSGTFVTAEEPTLTRHHPKFGVYTGVCSRCCTLCGFGQIQ